MPGPFASWLQARGGNPGEDPNNGVAFYPNPRGASGAADWVDPQTVGQNGMPGANVQPYQSQPNGGMPGTGNGGPDMTDPQTVGPNGMPGTGNGGFRANPSGASGAADWTPPNPGVRDPKQITDIMAMLQGFIRGNNGAPQQGPGPY